MIQFSWNKGKRFILLPGLSSPLLMFKKHTIKEPIPLSYNDCSKKISQRINNSKLFATLHNCMWRMHYCHWHNSVTGFLLCIHLYQLPSSFTNLASPKSWSHATTQNVHSRWHCRNIRACTCTDTHHTAIILHGLYFFSEHSKHLFSVALVYRWVSVSLTVTAILLTSQPLLPQGAYYVENTFYSVLLS